MRRIGFLVLCVMTLAGAAFVTLLTAAGADSPQPVQMPTKAGDGTSSPLPSFPSPATPSPTPTPVPTPTVSVPSGPPANLQVDFEPSIGSYPDIAEAIDIQLPLDEYRLSAEQARVRNTAWAALEQRCMARFGLEGIIGSKIGSPERSRLTKFLGITEAKSTGYRSLSSKVDSSPLPQRSGPISDQGAQSATQVFTGSVSSYHGQTVPTGGCRQEASGLINAGVGAMAIEPSDLSFASGALSFKDTRMVSANAAWSDCMKKLGYSYDSPLRAVGDPAWRTEQVTQAEKDTAAADAQCRVDTRIVSIQTGVESAYQKILIDKNRDALVRVKEQIAKQVENAAKYS